MSCPCDPAAAAQNSEENRGTNLFPESSIPAVKEASSPEFIRNWKHDLPVNKEARCLLACYPFFFLRFCEYGTTGFVQNGDADRGQATMRRAHRNKAAIKSGFVQFSVMSCGLLHILTVLSPQRATHRHA